jgi:beta-lactam-binding protein with PASTA domain
MRNVKILIAMIAVFLLVVPAAFAQVKPPQPVPVPNVVNMPLNAAQKALVAAGYNAVVTQENVTDPSKNNVVLKQQIAAGTTLAKGSNVPVVVGRYTAPAQQPVPNVVGMKLGEAQAALSKAKLNAAVTMQPVAEPQRNDVVLTQQIASGKALSPGSMVPIVVGKYTASTVPNVVGMKLGDAQAALAKVKLNAVVTMEKVNDKNKNGIVLKQQIATGSALVPGAQVPLIVGQYQEPVHVPSVVGMTEMQAETALKQAKLNASFGLRAATDRKKIGTVLEQNIAPGTAVEPGSQIIVVIGLDPSSKILQPQNNRPYPNRPYLTNPAIPADKQN